MHHTWFDDAWIEKTVSRGFVCSYLTPEEIGILDKPLLFGDGLTNDTYWEWIETKAKRLFLIFVDLGVPDQIFGVIDDSWEDDDLPIPLDQICRLALTAERDLKLENKFYDQQFTYLLRTIENGKHIDYGDQELVPLDVVEKRPASSHHDVVELPHCPGRTFSRRGIRLGLDMRKEDFMYEISRIRDFQNDHVESYYASYTHHDHAYVLFTPASEYKLASYLTNTPTCLKRVDKLAKRRLVLEWIQCLIDTLGFIHSKGEALGNIKPTTVSFTHDHHVVLQDGTCFNPDTLSMMEQGNKSFSKEAYDYAAPEQCSRPNAPPPSIRTWTSTMPSSAPDTKPRPGSSFAISRGGPIDPSHPHQHPLHHHRPAHADPQAADIFSLGCLILDLLSHGLLKHSSSAFAAVRSAKHKIAGRGGAVLDSSFHRNLGQVEVWMHGLSKDADKKAEPSSSKNNNNNNEVKSRLFSAVTPILHVVERMLAVQPGERPSASQVQGWVHQIITEVGGIHEPHCTHHHYQDGRDTGDAAGTSIRAPTFLEPPSPRFLDNASARQASSAPTILSKRSSVFSLRALGHIRSGSDESSSVDKSSVYTSCRKEDRWGLGGGWVTSMQNLRIRSSKTRFWQSPSLDLDEPVVPSAGPRW